MATLEIENVDLKLLEEQRQELINLSGRLFHKEKGIKQTEIDALEGIISLLEAWSDSQLE